MNVFVIPSWYPTEEDPAYGIFCRHAIEAINTVAPSWKFGVAGWGQGEEQFKLYAVQPLKNIFKWVKAEASGLTVNETAFGWEYRSPVWQWSVKWRKGNLAAMYQVCKEQFIDFKRKVGEVDALHAHVAWPGGVLAAALSEEFGIPFMLSEHHFPDAYKTTFPQHGIKHPWIQKAFTEAGLVVVPSHVLQWQLNDCEISNAVLIPNAVDDLLFSERLKGGYKDAFQWLYIGDLKGSKGIKELLKAVKCLLDKEKSVQLTLIGDGPDKKSLQKLADRLQLNSSVQWFPTMEQQALLSYLHASNALVLPSHSETFGIVLIEAGACGLPVLATACGGPQEIVLPETGNLCQPKDAETLAAGMEKVMEEIDNYNPSVIRKSILDRYAYSVVGQQWIDAFHHLISSYAPAAR